MGKTSSTVKDRYNLKAYDEIKVRVHKGKKAQIQGFAAALGETTNEFIEKSVEDRIRKDFPDADYTFNVRTPKH